MPRHTIDFDDSYSLELASVAYLKSPIYDCIPDAQTMFRIQLARFNNDANIGQLRHLAQKLTDIQHVQLKPIHKNRVYVMTNISYIPFLIVDMDEAVIEHMCFVLELSTECSDFLPPEHVSTVFIFQDKQLVLQKDIAPYMLAKLMAVFYKENLINFSGARYDWYGKPRRNAKNHQNDL